MALLKTLARLDKLIWTLIFGGLLSFVLGISLQRQDEATGFLFIVGGLLVTAVGALLVYVRSRMSKDESKSKPESN